LPKLRAVPGVVSAAAVITPPMSGDRLGISLELEGSAVKPSERPSADFDAISSDYFRTLGVPLIAGRDFNAHDEQRASQVMIVNQAFVRRFLAGKDPVGTRVMPEFTSWQEQPPWRTIVGVVGDIKHASVREDAAPKFFVPYSQGLISNLTIVVRTTGDPANMVNGLRAVIASMDSQLAVFNVRALDENIAGSLATEKFETFLLAIFAGLAFVLTAIGLYGVLAYTVAEQTHDFGVRMALGATTGTVLRLVLRSGLAITAVGLVIGVFAALGTDRLLAHALYGVGYVDPLTFAAVMAALILVCVLASYIPARRAAKVDPMVALRYE
jgi:putative ABC transport system permease protein